MNRLSRLGCDVMGSRAERPVPDLTGSTLIYVGDNHYIDSVTGMMLSRIGHPSVHGYEKALHAGREEFVHRIVAEAVHGPAPAGWSVNHSDGVKSNNRPENLEYASQSRQVSHAYEIGLRDRVQHPNSRQRSRLSSEQIAAIRSAERGTIQDVAAAMGITRKYAYAIRSGRSCRDS